MDLEDGVVHAGHPFLGVAVVEDDFGIWVRGYQLFGKKTARSIEDALCPTVSLARILNMNGTHIEVVGNHIEFPAAPRSTFAIELGP